MTIPGTLLLVRRLRIARDPLRLVLFVAVLFTIGRIQEHIPFLMPLRPALACTALAIILIAARPASVSLEGVLRTFPGRVTLVLAAFTCAAAPFGLSLGQSATYIIGIYSKVLVLGILLMLAIRNAGDLRTIVGAYLVAVAFLCWLAIFVVDLQLEGGSHVARLDNSEMGGMFDANDLGVIVMIAIPLALWMMQSSRMLGRLCCGALVVAVGVTIALSGSRGAFVGLAALAVILIVRLPRVALSTRLGVVAALALALAVAAPPGYWQQMKTIFASESDYNYTSEDGRMQIWTRGVGYMLAYPVFGIGPDNFGRAEGTISTKAREREGGLGLRYSAAHNSVVQIGAELGMTGLIIWSVLIGGSMRSLSRLRRRVPGWARGDAEQRFLHLGMFYLPIALVAFLLPALFVSFAYASPLYILVALCAGMHVAVRNRIRREARIGRALMAGAESTAPTPAAAAWGMRGEAARIPARSASLAAGRR